MNEWIDIKTQEPDELWTPYLFLIKRRVGMYCKADPSLDFRKDEFFPLVAFWFDKEKVKNNADLYDCDQKCIYPIGIAGYGETINIDNVFYWAPIPNIPRISNEAK
jgi:hypothetical protein